MEFKVIFKAEKGCLVNVSAKEIGLEGVDKIRKELGVSFLDLDVIKGTTQAIYSYGIDVEISEKQARDCNEQVGLFATSNTAIIPVPENFGHAFLKYKVVTEKDEVTGAIKKAELKPFIDGEEMFLHWAHIGYMPIAGVNANE